MYFFAFHTPDVKQAKYMVSLFAIANEYRTDEVLLVILVDDDFCHKRILIFRIFAFQTYLGNLKLQSCTDRCFDNNYCFDQPFFSNKT